MPLVASTGTRNAINFGLASSSSITYPDQLIGVAHGTTPFISVYNWKNNFGTKLANPSSLPVSAGRAISFTKNKTAVTLGTLGTETCITYSFSTTTGFGGTLGSGIVNGVCNRVEHAPISNAVAFAVSTSPFAAVYNYSSSGIGTKKPNPSTLPTACSGISYDSTESLITCAGTPNVMVYTASSGGWGTKFADPSSAINGTSSYYSKFNKTSTAIAIASNSSPYINTYSWSNGFGAKFADPSTLPVAGCTFCYFSDSESYIAVSHAFSPYVDVYSWSNSTGFGTKLSNPSPLPGTTADTIKFYNNDKIIGVAHYSSPFISIYPWSSAGFGTRFTSPSTLPTGGARDFSLINK